MTTTNAAPPIDTDISPPINAGDLVNECSPGVSTNERSLDIGERSFTDLFAAAQNSASTQAVAP